MVRTDQVFRFLSNTMACWKAFRPSPGFVCDNKNAGTVWSARIPFSRTCIWNSVLGYCVHSAVS